MVINMNFRWGIITLTNRLNRDGGKSVKKRDSCEKGEETES